MNQHDSAPSTASAPQGRGARPDASLDLRGTPCPINFVRTKLQLEKMAPGAVLEVWLDRGEPVEQVPDSLTMEGYILESLTDCSDYFALQVRRPG